MAISLFERLNRSLLDTDRLALFKRLLWGRGSWPVRVNLHLPNSRVESGGEIKGEVRLAGGSTSQMVEQVFLALVLEYNVKEKGVEKTVRRVVVRTKVMDAILVAANSPEVVLPVRLKVPSVSPCSSEKTRYRLEAGVEQGGSLVSADACAMTVEPNAYLRMLFEALTKQGFLEQSHNGSYINHYQRFSYEPTGELARRFAELTLFVQSGEQELDVIVDVSKHSDAKGQDRFKLPYARMQSPEQVGMTIQQLLAQI